MPTSWMIPAPDQALAQRVTLTLGVGAAQRFFREIMTPGIGGAMFVRQCSWAVAALMLKEDLPRLSPNIIAHGIEALGCKLAQQNATEDQRGTGRIRGVRAFARYPEAWSFSQLSQPKYYVHITFRQSVVTALTSDHGLGLTTGGRVFNAMTLTSNGQDLARSFLSQGVGRGSGALATTLRGWMTESNDQHEVRTDSVRKALLPWLDKRSPTGEATVIRARLMADHAAIATIGTRARSRLMTIFDQAQGTELPYESLLDRLRSLGFPEHATAIAAARSFEVLLNHARQCIHRTAEQLQSLDVSSATTSLMVRGRSASTLEQLRKYAAKYLEACTTANVRHLDSHVFATDLAAASDYRALLAAVVRRDGQIVALGDGGIIRRGSLFSAWRESATEDEVSQHDGLRSPRLRQAHGLWLDSHGR